MSAANIVKEMAAEAQVSEVEIQYVYSLQRRIVLINLSVNLYSNPPTEKYMKTLQEVYKNRVNLRQAERNIPREKSKRIFDKFMEGRKLNQTSLDTEEFNLIRELVKKDMKEIIRSHRAKINTEAEGGGESKNNSETESLSDLREARDEVQEALIDALNSLEKIKQKEKENEDLFDELNEAYQQAEKGFLQAKSRLDAILKQKKKKKGNKKKMEKKERKAYDNFYENQELRDDFKERVEWRTSKRVELRAKEKKFEKGIEKYRELLKELNMKIKEAEKELDENFSYWARRVPLPYKGDPPPVESISLMYNDICSICWRSFRDRTNGPVVQLNCGHFFHKKCIIRHQNQFFGKNGPKTEWSLACPVCRTPFTGSYSDGVNRLQILRF